jgi:hypothetical protein
MTVPRTGFDRSLKAYPGSMQGASRDEYPRKMSARDETCPAFNTASVDTIAGVNYIFSLLRTA